MLFIYVYMSHSFCKSKIYSEQLLNPCPAEPGYTLPLKTVDPDQLASKKPTDLDLHCLQFSM